MLVAGGRCTNVFAGHVPRLNENGHLPVTVSTNCEKTLRLGRAYRGALTQLSFISRKSARFSRDTQHAFMGVFGNDQK